MAEVETAQCKGGWLDATTFGTVIASTPLVSIDLLVKNRKGEYLFGLRKNRPAQGYWFVPGGRIQKNESLDAAFRRLTHEELGLTLERSAAKFQGVYEHFYKNSIFGEDISTHYVVLAYEVTLSAYSAILDSQQHSDVLWAKPEELSRYPVHQHSLDYF
ncbi:GDP-mannose mannosyl hydrolase [Pseudomonas sp. phDV1]|nr:GDP-mannose mannosyl hydrolase [Pseudomonas sp. phDV1]AXO61389.1 GDP-mannose mannosyl hydrolase [Pseudomonas sp. phDV1]